MAVCDKYKKYINPYGKDFCSNCGAFEDEHGLTIDGHKEECKYFDHGPCTCGVKYVFEIDTNLEVVTPLSHRVRAKFNEG